jgi:signal transduction histidine kinase
LTEAAGEMYGAHCRFETAGDVEIRSPAVAVHLYRIAQEALNNAIKHAQPRKVVVRLTGTGGREISVRVEDDGTGYDPARVGETGMGLRIMRYRAKMIGGTLEMRTRPGGGTAVSCTCAVPAAGAPAGAPLAALIPSPSQKDHPYDRRDQQQQQAVGTPDRQGEGAAGG